MDKFFEKIRKPLSYIALIVLIALSLIVGIGQCVDVGTLYLPPFTFAIVCGVCLFLYIIGLARGKDFPIIVALLVILFLFLLNPFLQAQAFEVIGARFRDNAALGLAEIINIFMILGGIAVLVLYLLEAIFGIKLSLVINILLLALVGLSALYLLLCLIGVIISLAAGNGASWYDLFSPLMPVAGYLFVAVNFGILESKTKNI